MRILVENGRLLAYLFSANYMKIRVTDFVRCSNSTALTFIMLMPKSIKGFVISATRIFFHKNREEGNECLIHFLN